MLHIMIDLHVVYYICLLLVLLFRLSLLVFGLFVCFGYLLFYFALVCFSFVADIGLDVVLYVCGLLVTCLGCFLVFVVYLVHVFVVFG